MMITNEAKQYIQSILEEQKAEGMRIHAVAGCCGPQIGLSLDAPEATDEVLDINGIRMAIAVEAKDASDSLTLDFEKQGEQSGLVMVGAPAGC
ncbi:adhesin [Planococcus kocurii]|uniref:adhesin n=1 Tax=Caryophanaceae TaxID=186818 RepID=UPI000C7E351C|nr:MULTISPECIES: adhesin [Planococcaceae]KAA0956153.1 adhesin [Planococcus sp. ANT_H30]PKH09197.1 adhesin [Planomicrobium sp. MB-3u-38]